MHTTKIISLFTWLCGSTIAGFTGACAVQHAGPHHHRHHDAHDLAMPLPVAMATLKVSSTALQSQPLIPTRHVFDQLGCQGQNQSPDVQWQHVPEGTRSFALIMHDPDAPTGVGFFHWLLWDIPAEINSLQQGASSQLPLGTIAGHTDAALKSYVGPCPPPDQRHRYQISVYALDVPSLGLSRETTGAMLRFALGQHVLAYGTVIGHYQR